MKVLLLHLSDMHIKSDDRAFVEKSRLIVNAIRQHSPDTRVLFIVVSGDIAHSGKQGEYDIALDFLAEIQEQIKDKCSISDVEIICVPGNHDCDFTSETETRRMLIKTVHENLDSVAEESVTSEFTRIQSNFFDFRAAAVGSAFSNVADRLLYVQSFDFDSKNLMFYCFNTSWMSRKEERQGQLHFPLSLLPEEHSHSDLAVSILHHPFNWFEANNARSLRNHITRTSDIILTGHEHDPIESQVNYSDGSKNEYVEGGVLKDNCGNSSFNIIAVDLDEKKRMARTFQWQESMYKPTSDAKWQKYERGHFLARDSFIISSRFASFLDDPGAGYTHPKVGKVRLSDIFVYPDFEVMSKNIRHRVLTQTVVEGRSFFDYFKTSGKVIVIGKDKAGKSALSKRLFRELFDHGYVPLLMNSENIISQNADKLLHAVEQAFQEQYSSESIEIYRQLSREEKAIVIDDFHKIKLNQKGKNKIVQFLEKICEKICLLCDDLYQFEEFIEKSDVENHLLVYKKCEILQFGYLLRERLIEKWYRLGVEYSVDKEELSYQIKKAESIVNTVIGKNLVPATPLVVLMVLQNVEAVTPANLAYGSLGYLYEFLITGSLALESRSKELDLDTKYSYLSELAYHIFENDLRELTEDDITEFHNKFKTVYDTTFDHRTMFSELVSAKLLFENEKSYSFKYPYIYYYFVARYLSSGLQDIERRSEIEKLIVHMIKNVYKEDYANISIFLSYLSKDSFIISEIIKSSQQMFKDVEPCNLDDDVLFLKRLSKIPLEFQLPNSDPDKNREEYLRARDREAQKHNARNGQAETISEEEETEEVLKLNLAFKTLQIMGQTARNFSGSLRADVKLTLTRECYYLGLRALKKFYLLTEYILDDLKSYVAMSIQEQYDIEDERRLDFESDRFIYLSCLGCAHGLIKRISYAVGSEKLSETFRKILKEHNTTAIRLTDISIKLDHFKWFPKREVVDLIREIGSRDFPSAILKQLVVEHLYLFHTSYKTRQAICDRLKISLKTSKIFDQSQKRQKA